MKTAILLGAGSSIPAGFPSTKCLTDRVLSGKGVYSSTDELYYVDFTKQSPSQTTQLVREIVEQLSKEAECCYSDTTGREPNYEDIFYLADQVSGYLRGEMKNPAVKPFVDNLRDQIKRFINSQPRIDFKNLLIDTSVDTPDYIADVALIDTPDYIADVVSRCLRCHKPKQATLGQLDLIKRGCNLGNITSISTLCHDTHVETYLEGVGIALSDGFSGEEAGVRYWNDDFPNNKKIPFLKLHGSTNWFRLSPSPGAENTRYDDRMGILGGPSLDAGDNWHDDKTYILPNDDPGLTQTIGGVEHDVLNKRRPLLLIGTFNKILDYSKGIFDDLLYRFRSTIRQANQMIICGYGFGDKGVNENIIEWYYAERKRRLIVIDPDDKLFEKARWAIESKWTRWKKEGNLILIEKPFEKVDIDEFEKKYFSD